jgi:DNA-binding NarL/FixJ family response regulator
MPISILLVDDHAIFREGIRLLLEATPQMVVVGEASDGIAAVSLSQKLKPDVIILDMVMPGQNGLEVTRRVKQSSPASLVIILSMHSDRSYILNAIKNGASGYVLKENSSSELIKAIHTVLSGKHFLSEPVYDQVVDAYYQLNQPDQGTSDILNPREQRIYRELIERHSVAEIAEQLLVEPRTIEKIQKHILEKLGFHNVEEMVNFAKSADRNNPAGS